MRLQRLRLTAIPTLLEAITANLVRSKSFGLHTMIINLSALDWPKSRVCLIVMELLSQGVSFFKIWPALRITLTSLSALRGY